MEKKIIKEKKILEEFGNEKNVKNEKYYSFGKFIRIKLDDYG